ncbi:MAG TPA: hypothetical protein VHC69_29985 [Polyangiaceae bacterium]|nr:hypothetical protein [Polyangiaceae bacterium]
MNVTSAPSLSTVDPTLSVGTNTNSAPPATSDGVGAPATTSISGPGRMFHELSQLSKSDPSKFKQVVGDMASQLRADAKNASGDEATRLNSIADRLDKVAQSGNLSDLRPQNASGGAEGAHHAHHGGHHHGGGAVMNDLASAFDSAINSDSSTTQPATSTTTG